MLESRDRQKSSLAVGDQMVHTIQPGCDLPRLRARFACATQQTPVVVLRAQDGQNAGPMELPPPSVNNLAFTSDGKALAVDCRTAVHLWNWKGRR